MVLHVREVRLCLVAHEPLHANGWIDRLGQRGDAVDVVPPQTENQRFDWFKRSFVEDKIALYDVYCM